jgi:DNA-binding CsgD family transcriptional regulator
MLRSIFIECIKKRSSSAPKLLALRGWPMTSTTRSSGLNVLGKMSWETHHCLFYETAEDLLDTLVPYFRAGLESNESCLWAVSEPLTVEDARMALSRGIPDFDRHLAAGSMDIVSGRDWYLKDGEFDLKTVTGRWDERLRIALAKGYEGMRVSGNASWLETKHWKAFCEYEQEIDVSVMGKPMIVLCTYPLGESAAVDVLEVAQAHQRALARRKGKWEVIETAEAQTSAHTLTPREREVLAWVAQGKSAWEIGEILDIAKRTVDEHVQTAVRKLGAANRTQAIALALHRRIIDL